MADKSENEAMQHFLVTSGGCSLSLFQLATMALLAKISLTTESWVEVEGQKETLTHTSSKEELKQLLASAASEEELSAIDNDLMYQVTFHASEDSGEEDSEDPPIKLRSSSQSQVPAERSYGKGICSLTFLVPVIILTHLAMFGIGYYLGRRWSADASSTVMKVFHV